MPDLSDCTGTGTFIVGWATGLRPLVQQTIHGRCQSVCLSVFKRTREKLYQRDVLAPSLGSSQGASAG